MSFFENTKKPEGIGGRLMVAAMNLGHNSLSDWGLGFLEAPDGVKILDCGCGGGANIKKLLAKYPSAKVNGVDYSEVSVEKSRRLNRAGIENNRCSVICASVAKLPFPEDSFDIVTAFETVYFWPGLAECFGEVFRVMKSGGKILVCNECDGKNEKNDKWTKIIPGLTIYTAAGLEAALEQAGFRNITTHGNNKGWLCVSAEK